MPDSHLLDFPCHPLPGPGHFRGEAFAGDKGLALDAVDRDKCREHAQGPGQFNSLSHMELVGGSTEPGGGDGFLVGMKTANDPRRTPRGHGIHERHPLPALPQGDQGPAISRMKDCRHVRKASLQKLMDHIGAYAVVPSKLVSDTNDQKAFSCGWMRVMGRDLHGKLRLFGGGHSRRILTGRAWQEHEMQGS
jgi:hypothetical protein